MSKPKKSMKFLLFLPIILIAVSTIFIFHNAVSAAEQSPAQTTAEHQTVKTEKSASWAKYLAAALSVALGCIAAGIAVAQVGSAAIGAISEKPELFGRALTFVGLSEGIAIWGLIIAILILYA